MDGWATPICRAARASTGGAVSHKSPGDWDVERLGLVGLAVLGLVVLCDRRVFLLIHRYDPPLTWRARLSTLARKMCRCRISVKGEIRSWTAGHLSS